MRHDAIQRWRSLICVGDFRLFTGRCFLSCPGLLARAFLWSACPWRFLYLGGAAWERVESPSPLWFGRNFTWPGRSRPGHFIALVGGLRPSRAAGQMQTPGCVIRQQARQGLGGAASAGRTDEPGAKRSVGAEPLRWGPTATVQAAACWGSRQVLTDEPEPQATGRSKAWWGQSPASRTLRGRATEFHHDAGEAGRRPGCARNRANAGSRLPARETVLEEEAEGRGRRPKVRTRSA